VLSLLLAAIFFAGIHLGVAGTTIRDRAITALGQSGYRVAFSIATVVGLAWLVMAYNRAPYVVTWGMLEWWKPFAIILMLPASLLVVIGLTTPNPTAVAQEDRLAQPPQGHCQINLCRAKPAGSRTRDHTAATAFCHWFAASARKIRSVDRETRWR
jgi:hypothetical protein